MMRLIGAILISVCPLILAIFYSQKLTIVKDTYKELIDLVDWLINEINYQKKELHQIIYEADKNDRFTNLDFFKSTLINLKDFPFPKAFKEGIDKWNTQIEKDDKELVKSMGDILGATEAKGQINSLEHIKNQLKISYEKSKEINRTKGKTAKTLGILMSIMIFVVSI